MRRKYVLIATVGCVIVVIGIGLLPRGLLYPLRVASGSMYPALVGPHWRCACPACHMEIAWGTESPPDQPGATCSNCGETGIFNATAVKHPGERVLLESWFRRRQPLQRWDVVAFYDPVAEDHRRLAVKRVAGLPGETLEIREGDLYVNSRLIRKTFAEFRSVAVLVHDDRYRPSSTELPDRWRETLPTHTWQLLPDGYGAQVSGGEPAWLVYHQQANLPPPGDTRRELPITDNDAYNQGLGRPLYFVSDFALSASLQTSAAGVWHFQLNDGDHRWEIRWDSTRKTVELRNQQEKLVERNISAEFLPHTRSRCWIALVDGQVLVTIDSHLCLSWTFDLAPCRQPPDSRPIAIAWQGTGKAQVQDLQVWRDIYLLHPYYLADPWKLDRPLSGGEVFVLGDNSPLSADGRTRGELAHLPIAHIIGRVRMNTVADEQP